MGGETIGRASVVCLCVSVDVRAWETVCDCLCVSVCGSEGDFPACVFVFVCHLRELETHSARLTGMAGISRW